MHRYACAHGYTLLYYRLAREGCEHPLWGARHPSYCKLAAIAAASTHGRSGRAQLQLVVATPTAPVARPIVPGPFDGLLGACPQYTALERWRIQALAEGYGHVVWLDSDAFVRDVTLDLPSLLRRYGGEPSTARGFKAADVTDAYFGWDAPYSLGPNAGFAVLRGEGGESGKGVEGGEGGGSGRGIGTGGRSGTAGALEMLAVWWQLYHGQYGPEPRCRRLAPDGALVACLPKAPAVAVCSAESLWPPFSALAWRGPSILPPRNLAPWQAPALRLEHAFEQHALHWQLLHLQPFRRWLGLGLG